MLPPLEAAHATDWIRQAEVGKDPVGVASESFVDNDVEIDPDGYWMLIVSYVAWTLAWIILFFLIRHIQHIWLQRFPRSDFSRENDENWCARNVLGMIHATLISVVSVPVMVVLLTAPPIVQFGATPHLGTCKITHDMPWSLASWTAAGESVAMAGMAFTTFTVADVFVSSAYRINSWEYCLHHTVYVAAGLLMRSNCMLPLTASILLSMETSTPFVNYYMLMVHRDRAKYYNSLTAAGIIFLVLFLTFRIVLNTYGAVYLCLNFDVAVPPWVPDWQLWLIIGAVIIGAIVQYVWLFPVMRQAVLWFRQGASLPRSDFPQRHLASQAEPVPAQHAVATPRVAGGSSSRQVGGNKAGKRSKEQQEIKCFEGCVVS